MFKYLTMYIVGRGRGMLAVLALAALITTSALLALPVSDLVWADNPVCPGLRITEARPNPFGNDTTGREGEWIEVTNFGLNSCTIVGGMFGGNSVWRFSEKDTNGDVARHLFPQENTDVILGTGETAIFAAFPDRFIATWFNPEAPCQVLNILNNPRFNNDKDEVVIRDSPNDGDNFIHKLDYDFQGEGGVPEDRSVSLLVLGEDEDGNPVLTLPTPCFPVACVPLFGILDEAECNIVPILPE